MKPTSFASMQQRSSFVQQCKQAVRNRRDVLVAWRAQAMQLVKIEIWSGRWDSNPRPQPWQANICRVPGVYNIAQDHSKLHGISLQDDWNHSELSSEMA